MSDGGSGGGATVAEEADGVVTIMMTAPGAGAAAEIVERLVEERLVACGNILPGATSIYRWEGRVHRDDESVVVLKTTRRQLSEALERAGELHPYDVPELLVHEVADGADAYLDWVRRECRPGSGAMR